MPEKNNLKYYILFDTNTHGFAMQALLKEEGIPSRIAPAPRAIQGELTCGMSLMIEPENIGDVRRVLEEKKPRYHAVRSLEGQINPHRDRYC